MSEAVLGIPSSSRPGRWSLFGAVPMTSTSWHPILQVFGSSVPQRCAFRWVERSLATPDAVFLPVSGVSVNRGGS